MKIMVLGLARSGIAAARYLLDRGEIVYLSDQKTKEKFDGALDELTGENARWHLGEDPTPLVDEVDEIVLSPGVPETHPAVLRAKARGIEVLAEIEFAYRESKGALLAITGTNGKTTTTSLLAEICKNTGRTTHAVGNIGYPYSAVLPIMKPGDITVCEVSSFQLETVKRFHPSVCAVLNIAEDHLNRHGTMERYIALKERIFENCAGEDCVVLNYEDLIVRGMAEHVKCRVLWFSTERPVPMGAFARDGMIVFGTPNSFKPICAADELQILGRHNLANALAACAMAMAAGVPAAVIRHTLRSFQGVEHRIEFTREVSGVRFYNDSKGTNVDSTLQAVRAMDRDTVILLGGSDKKTDFTPLVKEIQRSRVRFAVLIGDTAAQYADTFDALGFPAYAHAGYDFEKAIRLAYERAENGGNVLLSPGCASFDMFSDYEARGREFKRIVKDLEPKTT